MNPNPLPPELHQLADQTELGAHRAVYRPRATPVAVPLAVALTIYVLAAACLAGSNMLENSFGVIMLVVFTLFIGLGVLNVLHARRRSGAADELHLFDHGLIVKGPKTLVSLHHWDDATVYQRLFHYPQTGLTTYNYLLVAPDGAAISIGDPKGATGSALMNLPDLDHFTLGAAFDRPDEWGPAVQSQITRAQLPAVLARLQHNDPVTFGPLTLDRDTLTVDGTAIPLTGLQDAAVHDGTAVFKSYNRYFKTREPIHTIPNFFLFKEALQAQTNRPWS
ncbi:DUF6585 family protein [Glycomyces mayteni]|uniref:DUF6585 family protein n=1 Tax=Glycomyces mayteni TaxID=543887 RepID=A0ABW2DGP3_9ACTN